MPLPDRYKIKNKLAYGIICLIVGIEGSGQYKNLGIGDQCPDIYLDHIINYPKTSVHLSDFKDKLLILDLWGTWCGDCVAAFPKIDSLQEKYDQQVQILPVTTEDESNITHLLNNIEKIRGIRMPSAVNDTLLDRLFYHRYVPHYIWIRNGIVKAITGSGEINEANIKAFISNSNTVLPVKADNPLEFDFQKPLFASNQLKPKDILYSSAEGLPYHSVITSYSQEAPPGSRKRKYFIDCSNHIIKQLYQIAFGGFSLEFMNDNRVILENFTNSDDSVAVGFITPELRARWKAVAKQYSYCYEQVLTDTTVAPQKKFEFMQEDLNNFYAQMSVTGKMERRNVKVLVLIRTSATDKLKTKGGPPKDSYTNYFLDIKNKPINYFTIKLQAFFTQPGAMPVLDQTGYNGFVDIEMNTDLSDISSVNKELGKYDLALVEREMELDMIVLTKTSSNSIQALTDR